MLELFEEEELIEVLEDVSPINLIANRILGQRGQIFASYRNLSTDGIQYCDALLDDLIPICAYVYQHVQALNRCINRRR
jgi:hypothetical protein